MWSLYIGLNTNPNKPATTKLTNKSENNLRKLAYCTSLFQMFSLKPSIPL
nr:MAG TPA: hypothetical protein [Crassvirales sp.]